MRIRKKSWEGGELSTNKKLVHEPEEYKGKWKEYFGNDKPIYAEIGCGKGKFVIQNAIENPNINFIGIERQTTIMAIAARKTNDEMHNIALIRGDAETLADIFEPAELSRIYLNFSDPWPKKRWAKRRLTHRHFLEIYKSLLGGDKEIYLKTDNTVFFESSLNEFCETGWRLSNISLDLHNSGIEGNIMTEYEERFSSLGQPIYRLEARWPNNN
ncbi:tRNA (guanine-N(7)-)-methyltransferase [bioreactor metagenome]|uniref:tRNA (guanine(46)-N(7))-methyltransferase n=1 Tax=bioreactor metagenome TaxID=1076179 RepID=A0A645DFP7_9ZZZZ|nr:tRNA (guanosine(46)-N7)-methyltransferase TrmB [Candidatus Metalachnospira sp.]